METLLDFLSSQTGAVALGIAALGGLCAWIAALLSAPTDASGAAYRVFYAVVNWAGANLGKARNADDAARKGV